jgi:hypothetical protein
VIFDREDLTVMQTATAPMDSVKLCGVISHIYSIRPLLRPMELPSSVHPRLGYFLAQYVVDRGLGARHGRKPALAAVSEIKQVFECLRSRIDASPR